MLSKLTVALPSIPKLEDLDFAVVRTLDVHEILIQLIGAPVFSWGAHIENIYANKVTSSDDFNLWTVHFAKDAKFSDGSPLTAENWYHSIARTIRAGVGIHFNPKKDLVGGGHSKDGYCEGLKLEGNQVQLRINEANKNFPRLIGKVEATILPIYNDKPYQLNLIKGSQSGPCIMESYSAEKITLRLNPHFPAHKGRVQFKEVEIRRMTDAEAFEARIKGGVDFIFPTTPPPSNTRAKLEKSSQVYRDFGHTYFLGFRNHARAWLQNVGARQSLAAILSQAPQLEAFEKTNTLLIGKGFGRLASGPKFSSQLQAGDLLSLTLAAVDKPVSRHIVDFLEKSGVSAKVTWVKSFNELYSESARKTDAIIGWNDFCGEDPYISFYNALNPDRLLWADDDELRKKLTKIQAIDDATKKDAAYKEFHKALLESAIVIPIFEQWFDAFANPSLNLKSMLGSALWTIGG